MKAFFLLCSISLFLATTATSEDSYIFKFKKYNSDRSIRLDYLQRTEEGVVVIFTYTTEGTNGSFSRMYHNNIRVVDKKTGKSYYPENTSGVPKRGTGNCYFSNYDGSFVFGFVFEALPESVSEIDLIEDDGKSSFGQFRFTGLDITIKEPATKEQEDEVYDELDEIAFTKSFWTRLNLPIQISVNGNLVGTLNTSATSMPECGDVNTFVLIFPGSKKQKKKFEATARKGNRKLSWEFEFEIDDTAKCVAELK